MRIHARDNNWLSLEDPTASPKSALSEIRLDGERSTQNVRQHDATKSGDEVGLF